MTELALNDLQRWCLLKSGWIRPELGGYTVRNVYSEKEAESYAPFDFPGVVGTFESARAWIKPSDLLGAALSLCTAVAEREGTMLQYGRVDGVFRAAFADEPGTMMEARQLSDALLLLVWQRITPEEQEEAHRMLNTFGRSKRNDEQ